jgi:hypothetical protein
MERLLMFLPRKKESGYETIKRLQDGQVGSLHHVAITGDDAAKLLEESANCRSTHKGTVAKYEEFLRLHGYNVHGDTFDFSSAGREDGTHRLTAIRNVGGEYIIPVKIIPPGTGVEPYFDVGKTRDYKDIATVNGVSISAREWTIVNTFCRFILGVKPRPHEKHLIYSRFSSLFDEADARFKNQAKGYHNCFATCWVVSQLEADGVSERTRKSLEEFSLWLNENYKVVGDLRDGAVCLKLREDFKEFVGSSENCKKEVIRRVMRYSIGRKWEKQKNRTVDSNVVRSDEKKVSEWIGGVK